MSVVASTPQGAAALPPPSPPPGFDAARLPGAVAGKVWRGSELGSAQGDSVATGFAALDAELPGGGWPRRALTEILQPQPALCEWRLLAPSLKRLVKDGGRLLLVGPPKRPHAPGLAQLGLPAAGIVWFAADTPAERLWTTEQLVKANPRGAILAWLPQARAEQLRRLQVHAQSCECPVFLLRPELAQRDASPAPLRILAALGVDWALDVRILKRMGGHHEGVLSLTCIPGLLAQVLTPRLLRPSQLMLRTEASDATSLGSAAAAGLKRRPLARA